MESKNIISESKNFYKTVVSFNIRPTKKKSYVVPVDVNSDLYFPIVNSEFVRFSYSKKEHALRINSPNSGNLPAKNKDYCLFVPIAQVSFNYSVKNISNSSMKLFITDNNLVFPESHKDYFFDTIYSPLGKSKKIKVVSNWSYFVARVKFDQVLHKRATSEVIDEVMKYAKELNSVISEINPAEFLKTLSASSNPVEDVFELVKKTNEPKNIDEFVDILIKKMKKDKPRKEAKLF
jgi:hypothetical protein